MLYGRSQILQKFKIILQTHVVEVCNRAGKRNKLLQPVHLCSKKGSFACLHISSSRVLKDFAYTHIWPLFMRAEFLFPSCLVPAGFVCKVPCIPPPAEFLGDLGHSACSWAACCTGTHYLYRKYLVVKYN